MLAAIPSLLALILFLRFHLPWQEDRNGEMGGTSNRGRKK